MRHLILGIALVLGLALPVAAAECGAGGKGATSIHYDTGKTALTAADKAKLKEFANQAKFSDSVCVFAQVDAQGSEAANKRVAAKRAENVKRYLVQAGVKADRILIAKAEEAFTLFGLLKEDSKNDRRVTVSYE